MDILVLLTYVTFSVLLLIGALLYFVLKLVYGQEQIEEMKDIITKSYDDFLWFYERDRYFSKRDLKKWLNNNKTIPSLIEKYLEYDEKIKRYDALLKILPFMNIKQYGINDDYKNKIFYVSNIFKNGNEIREKRNNYYIKEELEKYGAFFSNFCSKPLSEEQKRIIITDEAHNLVVAGAGTGKTLTLVGKAGYLIHKKIAEPNDLLLLSFARKARDEMKNRIQKRFNTELEVRTFHSLGLEITRSSLGYDLQVSDLAGDRRSSTKTIDTLLQNRLSDINFANKLNEYFVFFLRPVENELDFKSEADYDKYLKEKEIRTLNGEKVKSFAECDIANFLFLKGIKYRYAEVYPHNLKSKRQYRPDFFLPDYDIWIEHLGVNRKCGTAPGVDRWRYLDEWYWKRKTHNEHGTTLIETYTYERQEGVLISNLENKLREHEIEFKPISNEKIFYRLKFLGEVRQFSTLLTKFLNLYKSNPQPMEKLKEKARKYSYSKRYLAFIDIFKTLYEDYDTLLRESGKIDFHDMINLATEQIKNGSYKSRFKYILVDEFQDISHSRNELIKALLDCNEKSQIFCVGDDWQSIYRFTGSDLSIMVDYGEHFDPYELTYLTRTYRFNNKINDVSSKFIMKNQNQYKKNLLADSVDHPGITIVWYDRHQQAFLNTLQHINSLEQYAEVQVIGRYSKKFYPEIFDQIDVNGYYVQQRLDMEPLKLRVKYTTAHSAKGTESDYIVLLGVKSDKYGVPCEIEDDPVLRLVLSEIDSYPYAEERRVFYVALTRAKKQVFILADRDRVSKFIQELVIDNPSISMIGEPPILSKCPLCESGIIFKTYKNGKQLASCSNSPTCVYQPIICPQCKNGILLLEAENNEFICSNKGCHFTARKCPRCEDGYLVEREYDGKFWGCSNYKEKNCRYIEPIQIEQIQTKPMSIEESINNSITVKNVPEKKYTYENVRQLHSNAYKSWSEKEDQDLAEEINRGLTINELERIHQRKRSAIQSRIRKLKLKRTQASHTLNTKPIEPEIITSEEKRRKRASPRSLYFSGQLVKKANDKENR